jgi:hypothetical protein
LFFFGWYFPVGMVFDFYFSHVQDSGRMCLYLQIGLLSNGFSLWHGNCS